MGRRQSMKLVLELEPMGLMYHDNKGSKSWPPFNSMKGSDSMLDMLILLSMFVDVKEDRRLMARVDC